MSEAGDLFKTLTQRTHTPVLKYLPGAVFWGLVYGITGSAVVGTVWWALSEVL